MKRVRAIAGRIELVSADDPSRTFVFPTTYVLVHDPTGTALGKCSLFIGPARKTNQPASGKKSKFDAAWYGDDYELRKAIIDVPSDGWHSLGHVSEIVYYRPGKYEDDWKHRFDEPQPLFRSGRWHMIVFPAGCEISGRGIVRP